MTTARQELAVDRILRCRKTNRYYTGEGWSNQVAGALSFPNQLEAVRTSILNDLHEVDLVVVAQGLREEIFCARLR